MREAYVVIAEFSKEGSNLGGVIQALVLPLKLAVQLLGWLGEGTMEAIIMFKVMNTIIPQNTMFMMANAVATLQLGTASASASKSIGMLAAAQGASNLLMFAGFLLINRGTEGAYILGNAIL